MMRKNLVLFALLGLIAFPFASNAEVLLWLVNTPVTGTDFGGTERQINWSYAVLRATTADSANQAIYGGTGAPIERPPEYSYFDSHEAPTGVAVKNYLGETPNIYAVTQSTFANASGSDVAADLDSLASLGLTPSELNFYIELYDSSNILVGYSSEASYDALADFRTTARYFSDWNSYQSWGNDVTWTAVPEPTSGMLALLGLVALGLRRRRV